MSDAAIASSLCTACGLCCNGALIDYGPLEPDELSKARSCGMRVLQAENKAAFALPCPQLSGSECQIYGARPGTCRAYECKNLRAAQRGEIDRDTALERIAAARAALEEVNRHLPEGATVADARRWRREAGRAEAAEHLTTSPMLMMALGLLDIELDLHFRKRGQRQIMSRDE